MRIAVVYEITDNPLFSTAGQPQDDRLTEFAQPCEVNDLLRLIQDAGYDTEVVDGPAELLRRATEIRRHCGIVFNKSIGFRGLERKIHVPAICQLFDIPFIGSSAYAMTAARHKFHTNCLLRGLGLPVPGTRLYEKHGNVDLESIRPPYIVKPNHESDAIGISTDAVVNSPAAARARARWVVDKFEQPAIIEEFIPGEEWKVAVIGNGTDTTAVGCVGVMRDGVPIVGSLQTRDDVVGNTLSYYQPTRTELVHQAGEYAVKIHTFLGLLDYSRCDFRLSLDETLVCMEVSTHPELRANSSFGAAARLTLGSAREVVRKIIAVACARYQLA
ncbi:MAG: hypothetical protein O7D91_11390 [Planctomycetota bacterium]|nr:hypothetical protein [Planctomycetota bacterium]